MQEVFAKARAMGATDAAIVRWLDRVLTGFGLTPRSMIDRGLVHLVLADLDRSASGAFA